MEKKKQKQNTSLLPRLVKAAWRFLEDMQTPKWCTASWILWYSYIGSCVMEKKTKAKYQLVASPRQGSLTPSWGRTSTSVRCMLLNMVISWYYVSCVKGKNTKAEYERVALSHQGSPTLFWGYVGTWVRYFVLSLMIVVGKGSHVRKDRRWNDIILSALTE